jgi:hypothetical protein
MKSMIRPTKTTQDGICLLVLDAFPVLARLRMGHQ